MSQLTPSNFIDEYKKIYPTEEDFKNPNKSLLGFAIKKSSNDKQKAVYMNLIFNPTKQYLSIKQRKLVLGSSTKMPFQFDEDTIPKYQTVIIKKMLRKDIAGGDYVPKLKDNEEDQVIENTRMNHMIDSYEKSML